MIFVKLSRWMIFVFNLKLWCLWQISTVSTGDCLRMTCIDGACLLMRNDKGYLRNLMPNEIYQRNLLPNNSIVDWVTIEGVRIERFFSEVVTIEKEKMHQKMNYAFNQNLFCCNCISFENFFHAICQYISMNVGFTNKSGASQGFEKFNLL